MDQISMTNQQLLMAARSPTSFLHLRLLHFMKYSVLVCNIFTSRMDTRYGRASTQLRYHGRREAASRQDKASPPSPLRRLMEFLSSIIPLELDYVIVDDVFLLRKQRPLSITYLVGFIVSPDNSSQVPQRPLFLFPTTANLRHISQI
jgi:hypothetical protein